MNFPVRLFGTLGKFSCCSIQTLLLLLKPQSAGADRSKLQTALTDHHGNHREADSFEQPDHPEYRLPSLGRFHGAASFLESALISDH